MPCLMLLYFKLLGLTASCLVLVSALLKNKVKQRVKIAQQEPEKMQLELA